MPVVKTPKTHTCFTCKTVLPATMALQYKDKHWYCAQCFEEKSDKEWFASQVCTIFGLKTPGPRLYAERKRLKNNYGYTDKTIIETLKYLLYIKKMQIKSAEPSLYLITPITVDEYTAYRRLNEREEQIEKKLTTKNITATPKRIVTYNDNEHPIRVPIKTSSSWDELLEDDE